MRYCDRKAAPTCKRYTHAYMESQKTLAHAVFLADRTVTQYMIGYWHHNAVCLSVCLSVCNAVHCGAKGR